MLGLALSNLISRNAKALAAFGTSLIVTAALHLGVELPADVQLTLSALLVSLVVWLTPNKG